jgi:TPP-dependent trihydroxycyclohexane-1,2-dione (THcHDO) dehydratase
VIIRNTDKIQEEDLEKAVNLIRKSKKLFIIVGGGIVNSDAEEI